MSPSQVSLSLLSVLLLAACGGEGNAVPPASSGSPPPASGVTLSAQAALGEKIFHDASLSASGQLSCASCHVPAHAFAGDQPTQAVPTGGAGMNVAGFRNSPSLKYLTLNPAFFFDDEGTPTGGFDRDGRVSSLIEQARRPFLAAHEMANPSAADVA